MRKYLLSFFCIGSLFCSENILESEKNIRHQDEYMESVVQIFNTCNQYNQEYPWQAPTQYRVTGSGFFISKNWIVTNAHVIADSFFLQVKLSNIPELFDAQVAFVDRDCNLAIIEVLDENIQKIAKPLVIATSCNLQDKVHAVGYPMLGDGICVTEGVISRSDFFAVYSYSQQSLPVCQIDSHTHHGSSGGPILSTSGEVVGVCHQGIVSENIDQMIPLSVLRHFLTEVKKENYKGFPKMGFSVQFMINPALRDFYQMPASMTGIMINSIDSDASTSLKEHDILFEMEGLPIANDGTIMKDSKRIPANLLLIGKFYGENVQLGVWRDGQEMHLSVPLIYNANNSTYLASQSQVDIKPTYLIYGGLIFQPLTEKYLETYGEDWWRLAPKHYLYEFYFGRNNDKQESVILHYVLTDRVNLGYQEIRGRILREVNGQQVNSMKHLATLINEAQGNFIRFKLDDESEIILNRDQVQNRQQKILDKYDIAKERSQDLIL